MRKSKLQGFLTVLLAASLLTCWASAASFPDVDSGSSCAAAIDYVSQLGLMVGDNQGNFNPDGVVNRAEMATIVCRVLNQTENLSKSEEFTDTPVTHWVNAYIGKACQLGIVTGYGGGKFGPADPVTYEQAVTMIVRAIGKEDSAVAAGGYPNGYLSVAQENGLLNGIQAQQGQGLSRGNVAVLLYNYCTAQGSSAAPEGGHIHNYIEKTVPGSGHTEQVQVGTKEVYVRTEKRQYSQCLKCGAIAYTSEEIFGHYDPESPFFSRDCILSHNMIYDEYIPIYEEQPVYEDKWVEDTICVCSICGQQRP